MGEAARLTLGRKIAIGAGDFGFNLYWQTAGLYLLFFYTDALGLPAAQAGAIYMVALVWDALLDPVVGLIADRTRTRWGRYRPYFLFGAVPLALTFAIAFMGPASPALAAVVFAAATHVLFRSLYAVVSIPYASLFARITRDSAQRGDLTGIRMIFATTGAIAVAFLTLPLVKALGTPEDPRRGWVILGAAYGLLSTLAILGVAWASRGLDVSDETPAPRRPSGQVIRSLLTNRALLLVLGAVVVGSFSGTMFSKNLLYYFKYVLGQPDMGSSALGLGALVAAICMPLWTPMLRLIGKRNVWLLGSVPGMLGLCLWHFSDGQAVWILFVAIALQAVGAASFAVCFWSMLPDTVEYGEWRSGLRTESLVFGLTVLGQKAALGLGAGLLGVLLTHVGYQANAVQTPETLAGIKAMMFWWPFIGGLISLTLILFYPLDRKTHGRMVEEIAARAAPVPAPTV